MAGRGGGPASGDIRWKTLSLQVSLYGDTAAYGLVQVLIGEQGGVRKRVLSRGAIQLPPDLDPQVDPARVLELVARHTRVL